MLVDIHLKGKQLQIKTAKHTYRVLDELDEKMWNLVALGDSTPTGYGVEKGHSYVQVYAEYIEKDLEVDVMIHNWATNETRKVADWVNDVQNNEELRDDLRNARIITMWLGWHDVILHILVERNDSSLRLKHELEKTHFREITEPMEEAYNQLLLEIASLANPEKTLILIADVGIPALIVKKCREYGILDVWKKHAHEVWRGYIIQSAKRHNIHVVHTYAIINGPDGNQETPSEYMQSDGVHFNERGHRLIADAHRKVGYQCLHLHDTKRF